MRFMGLILLFLETFKKIIPPGKKMFNYFKTLAFVAGISLAASSASAQRSPLIDKVLQIVDQRGSCAYHNDGSDILYRCKLEMKHVQVEGEVINTVHFIHSWYSNEREYLHVIITRESSLGSYTQRIIDSWVGEKPDGVADFTVDIFRTAEQLRQQEAAGNLLPAVEPENPYYANEANQAAYGSILEQAVQRFHKKKK